MTDCEPLRKKKCFPRATSLENFIYNEYEQNGINKGQQTKPFLIFDDVVSAARFYKRYRVSTEHIKENYQLGGVYNIDLWNDYPELVKKYLEQDKNAYNEWLFDYCFGDVIE